MILILILLCLLGTKVAHAAVKIDIRRRCEEQKINVANFLNLVSQIGSLQKSLNDVPSLATLANDPRAALPESFTICSDIMSVFSTKRNYLMFFNLLGRDGEPFLSAIMVDGKFFTTRVAKGKTAIVFPNKWVRSCMAIHTVSGIIQWVVDGSLVENNTIDALKGPKVPIDLNGRIILGARKVSKKSWYVLSNKLTNLNIFSCLLLLELMQRRTNGEDICLEEGDYLAWSEMKWDLQGRATIEKIRKEELDTKPLVNLYSARVPMRDCKHFCENLGTQMPSVFNTTELGRFTEFCREKMIDLSHGIWLAADDTDEEGVWRDSLTGQPLKYTPPWEGTEPNGGTAQNCAAFQGCGWVDIPCDRRYYCPCHSQPRPSLKFLGLCKETFIDRDYQPQNDVKDIETLTIVGHSTSIKYDQNQMLWLMNVVNSNVTGTSIAPYESFILGKKTYSLIRVVIKIATLTKLSSK